MPAKSKTNECEGYSEAADCRAAGANEGLFCWWNYDDTNCDQLTEKEFTTRIEEKRAARKKALAKDPKDPKYKRKRKSRKRKSKKRKDKKEHHEQTGGGDIEELMPCSLGSTDPKDSCVDNLECIATPGINMPDGTGLCQEKNIGTTKSQFYGNVGMACTEIFPDECDTITIASNRARGGLIHTANYKTGFEKIIKCNTQFQELFDKGETLDVKRGNADDGDLETLLKMNKKLLEKGFTLTIPEDLKKCVESGNNMCKKGTSSSSVAPPSSTTTPTTTTTSPNQLKSIASKSSTNRFELVVCLLDTYKNLAPQGIFPSRSPYNYLQYLNTHLFQFLANKIDTPKLKKLFSSSPEENIITILQPDNPVGPYNVNTDLLFDFVASDACCDMDDLNL